MQQEQEEANGEAKSEAQDCFLGIDMWTFIADDIIYGYS